MTDSTSHLDPNAMQDDSPGKTRVNVEQPFDLTQEHTGALVQLATSARGKLTPAQARAALHRAGLSAPEALADLAAGARLLAAQLRTLEVAAGSAARTAGMDTLTLATQVGISQRTVQERYRHWRIRPELPGHSPYALLKQSADDQPLPVVVELSTDTGRLAFNHMPAEVAPTKATWTGTLWRWPVRLLTGPGATNLLQRLHPLAERILVGTDLIDGCHVPDADAREAAAEVTRICEHAVLYPALRQVEAHDYFTDQDPTMVATALGLPVGADHVQVATAAEVARENALHHLVLLTGAETYLAGAITPAETVNESDVDAKR